MSDVSATSPRADSARAEPAVVAAARPSCEPLRRAERWVVASLIVFGSLDLVALAAVFLPWSWMNAVHQTTGLGELPQEPVVGYLARTASLLYALHGAVILFVACDVRRYWPLVRFLAAAAVVHGGFLVYIDVLESLPGWWQFTEGFCIAATGGMVWLLSARANRDRKENGHFGVR